MPLLTLAEWFPLQPETLPCDLEDIEFPAEEVARTAALPRASARRWCDEVVAEESPAGESSELRARGGGGPLLAALRAAGVVGEVGLTSSGG